MGQFWPSAQLFFQELSRGHYKVAKGEGCKEGKFSREASLRKERKRRSMESIAVKDLMLTITSLLENRVKAMETCL